MAEKSRSTSRKLKDKWKSKEWYRVLAPDMFGGVEIAQTVADDPSKLIGRVTEVTVHDLTGDLSRMHIKLRFKVSDVRGHDAFTRFIGHDYTSDYIRRLTRRKRSKMDGVFNVVTKDGYRMCIKPMAITDRRIQTSQQKAIRSVMRSAMEQEASTRIIPEFIRGMINGDIAGIIKENCKPIYPLKKLEIRKSEIVKLPEGGEPTYELRAAEIPEPAAPPAEEPPASGPAGSEQPSAAETALRGPSPAPAVPQLSAEAIKAALAELTKIQGVGPAKAEALIAKGFVTLESVKKATPEQLAEVDGISITLAKRILANAEKL